MSSTVVAAAGAGSTRGYWTVSAGGQVYAHDGARNYGSLAVGLGPAVTAIASTSNGHGYWLVTSTGRVYPFGNAHFHGYVHHPAGTVIGIAATANNGGYWLVTSTGRVYPFGNAHFHGYVHHPAGTVVAIAPTANNGGYWLVTSTGHVYPFGNAHYYGYHHHVAGTIIAFAALKNGRGYWEASTVGAVYAEGAARYRGSGTSYDASTQAATVAILPFGSGYRLPTSNDGVASIGIPTARPAPAVLVTSFPPRLVANPLVSTAPSAAFIQACFPVHPNVASCNSAALADIDSVRATEGLGPLTLPSNFYSLGGVAQILAVANAERTSRMLPALPESAPLDSLAQAGAVAGVDPSGPGGYGWGSNISWGYPTALAADFAWMYDDGLGSNNIDCTSRSNTGCWGHRENILSPWAGKSGAGVYVSGNEVQLTELFVENY